MTIDVEDYYHVSGFQSVVPFEHWHCYESRVERNTRKILEILEEYRVKATFFVLGCVAEHHAGLVKDIHRCGHEIASHGYFHRLVYAMTPSEFRIDVSKSKKRLEDLIGEPVLGHRAASYSIVTKSLWSLQILVEEGFRYDSSIFPVLHDRYGIPDAARFTHPFRIDGHGVIFEIPPSTIKIGGINIPIAGGGYLRVLPYSFINWGIRRINGTEQQPAVMYLHPWELDPDQPRINGQRLARWRHYVNLHKTEAKFKRLLAEFRFGTIRELFKF